MTADPDTDDLLDAAAQGDRQARGQLLNRHRARLVRMVAVRLNPRLAARIDPSDVVQEALAEADRRLDVYLTDRPLPFYPWLRQLAWTWIREYTRRHVRASRRSIQREVPVGLPDGSAFALAERLLDNGTGPSAIISRAERRALVRSALDRLNEKDREVLVLRYLEELSTADTAAVLGISQNAAKVRLLRALHRLRDLLDQTGDES